MTEIKLMNYGRGAGKTYTLQKWQLEKPDKRFIVVPAGSTGNYPEVKIGRVFTHLEIMNDNNSLHAYSDIEVAFDDFLIQNQTYLAALRGVFKHSPKTVILATSYEAMQTEAHAKTWSTDEWRTFHSFPANKANDLIVDGAIQRPLPTEIKDSDIYEAAEKAEIKRIIEEASEQKEPIQSVKARDLRIGDWVVGKGHVFSLTADESRVGGLFKVYTEDKALGFEGEMRLMPDHLLDVDITKRK